MGNTIQLDSRNHCRKTVSPARCALKPRAQAAQLFDFKPHKVSLASPAHIASVVNAESIADIANLNSPAGRQHGRHHPVTRWQSVPRSGTEKPGVQRSVDDPLGPTPGPSPPNAVWFVVSFSCCNT